MASRMMISPVVTTVVNGVTFNRSKAESYCNLGFVNFFPVKEDGTNATSFVLTLGRATSWTAADADAQIEKLFPIPASIDTAAELRDWLKTHTVADLTVAQRNAMQAIFDNHAIPRSDFTLTTTGAQVMQRIVSFLLERDFNFGLGFQF